MRRDAQGAELGETGIEPPADLAEVDVAGIAERQHAEVDALEAGRALGHQALIEFDRALRRVALAPGAGDHQQVGHLGDLGGRGLGHVDQLRRETLLGRRLLGLGRDPFGVARFGPVEDRQRNFRPWFGQGCGQGQRGRGMVARKKARKPLPLLEVGLGHHGVQRPDVLDREGRALGQDGQGGAGHGSLSSKKSGFRAPLRSGRRPSRRRLPAGSVARAPGARRGSPRGRSRSAPHPGFPRPRSPPLPRGL